MLTIHLHKLQFYSFHGIHAEEKLLGNTYEVNVDIFINADKNITALEETVNYATVYEMIRQRMNTPTQLLETIAQSLVETIYAADRRIKKISINIQKKYPPLTAIEGSVGVTVCKEF